MKYLSAPVGAVVRVWFPESEAVLVPGPKLRPCIVLAEEIRDGRPMVLVGYGTSQNTWGRDIGEFTVQAGLYNSLPKDTKFRLKRAIWLPLRREDFQGKPEMLRDADLRACVLAIQEAKIL